MNEIRFKETQGTKIVQQKPTHSAYASTKSLGNMLSHSKVKNCVELEGVQNNYHNSNLSPEKKLKDTCSFMDPVLTSLVDNLMDQVSVTTPQTRTMKSVEAKLQKNSNPFLMKNSLNNSIVSTSASDDCNSCERSTSDLGCKAQRSDSLTDLQTVKRRDSNVATEVSRPLFKIPEQSPAALIEQMMHVSVSPENAYINQHASTADLTVSNFNIKKPVPNKYKTEICRNWEIEGSCRFGDECTFAHGGRELHKRASMPLNYKTKVCKQFTEEPYFCPYGEKCQFLHISQSEEDAKTIKYSVVLNETLKQMEKRLVHLGDSEEFEIPTSVFKKQRLSIFKELTDNCNEDSENNQNYSFSQSSKKTTLNKRSKEFIMPKRKAQGGSSPAQV